MFHHVPSPCSSMTSLTSSVDIPNMAARSSSAHMLLYCNTVLHQHCLNSTMLDPEEANPSLAIGVLLLGGKDTVWSPISAGNLKACSPRRWTSTCSAGHGSEPIEVKGHETRPNKPIMVDRRRKMLWDLWSTNNGRAPRTWWHLFVTGQNRPRFVSCHISQPMTINESDLMTRFWYASGIWAQPQ